MFKVLQIFKKLQIIFSLWFCIKKIIKNQRNENDLFYFYLYKKESNKKIIKTIKTI